MRCPYPDSLFFKFMSRLVDQEALRQRLEKSRHGFFFIHKVGRLSEKKRGSRRDCPRFFLWSWLLKWQSPLREVLDRNRLTKDTTYLTLTILASSVSEARGELAKLVSSSLRIEESLRRLEQELWAQDSQELR